MISTRLKHETSRLIQGPAGQLELYAGKAQEEHKAWGIVCHPHPLHGGTMNNKIVTTLVKTFQALNVATIRFNFRGVGMSEGEFDEGEGELYDLLAVVDWVLQEQPDREIWLAGFSFGAYIAAKAATQIPVAQLVTVAPPVNNFHMYDLPPIMCPWIVAQGDRDEVVPPLDVIDWAESRTPKPLILRFPEASHFFHGMLTELRTRLEEVLRH